MSWTAGTTAYWAIAAVPIKPAATGPPLTTIAVTAPTGTPASYAQGTPVTVAWSADPDVTTGEYGVWAEASNGNWYGGDLVAASAPHSHDLTLAVPLGTGYSGAACSRLEGRGRRAGHPRAGGAVRALDHSIGPCFPGRGGLVNLPVAAAGYTADTAGAAVLTLFLTWM